MDNKTWDALTEAQRAEYRAIWNELDEVQQYILTDAATIAETVTPHDDLLTRTAYSGLYLIDLLRMVNGTDYTITPKGREVYEARTDATPAADAEIARLRAALEWVAEMAPDDVVLEGVDYVGRLIAVGQHVHRALRAAEALGEGE